MAADDQSGHADGVDASELTAEEAHLLAGFADLLADPTTWAAPSAHVAAAIKADIDAAAHVAPSVTSIESARSRRTRWTGPVVAALAGAAAAALVAVAVRPSADDAGQAAPTVALAGTELTPGVSGTARLVARDSGTEIRLSAAGMRRRDGGDFYQMWVKSCSGDSLVPAGTFHTLDEVVGWIGVSTADFPILTVTRERAAGPTDSAQGSSGEVVLIGTLGACPS